MGPTVHGEHTAHLQTRIVLVSDFQVQAKLQRHVRFHKSFQKSVWIVNTMCKQQNNAVYVPCLVMNLQYYCNAMYSILYNKDVYPKNILYDSECFLLLYLSHCILYT